MCKTTEDKYFVKGAEVLIDKQEELSKDVAAILEQSPMTQLDAYYVRKNIHHLSQVLESFVNNVTAHFDTLEQKIKEQERSIESFTVNELSCKANDVPAIASKIVHEIVNGKFGNISNELSSIKSHQLKTASILESYKIEQAGVFQTVLNKLELVSRRTIFGWIKWSYETKPIKTILAVALGGILLFVYLMTSLHIKSFGELLEIIKHWFS